MPSTKVVLAGATGNLGGPILKALLNAGFDVTVVSREGGNSSKLTPHPNLDIKEVDFTRVESMTPALSGAEAVISCLATSAIGSQNPLIDAAVAAGVKRFIPAEFGMDSENALCAQLPVIAFKVATKDYLLEKSASNPSFTYTAIANGLFLDWCIEQGLLVDLKQHSATLYNGGDVPMSVTLLADIAKTVLGVIEHQEETKNRLVYVHSALITQNQLIQYAKDKDGKEWSTVVKDTEELRKESIARIETGSKEDHNAGILALSFVGTFDKDYGCDYSDHLDNDLFGVKVMNQVELRALFESLM
jgi:hypothetical protein